MVPGTPGILQHPRHQLYEILQFWLRFEDFLHYIYLRN